MLRWRGMTAEERLWARVCKGEGYQPGACWEWLSSTATDGYGVIYVGGRQIGAHRFAYELARGPIPRRLEIDHLCRVRHCVNPSHMEAVSRAVNIARGLWPSRHHRKTHCIRGHPLAPPNLYKPSGTAKRRCKQCSLDRYRNKPRREPYTPSGLKT